MTSTVLEDAKADRMPRYEQPSWNELQDDDTEGETTCESCNWWIKCTEGDARQVLGEVNPYTHIARNRYSKTAVTKAVMRCGICVKHTGIRACTCPCCEDWEERA